MSMPVDENGAFFTGSDPSFYRVRGGEQPVEDMITSGCARQVSGMRLIMIDVAQAGTGRGNVENTDNSSNNSDTNETDS